MRRELTMANPFLPPFLRELQIRDLRVAGGSIDLILTRQGDEVIADVTRAEGVSFLNQVVGFSSVP